MEKITENFALTAFIVGVTATPVMQTQILGTWALFISLGFFVVDLLYKVYGQNDNRNVLWIFRDYLPPIGVGFLAHSITIGFVGGPPLAIAIYGVLGVVMILIYIFTMIVKNAYA